MKQKLTTLCNDISPQSSYSSYNWLVNNSWKISHIWSI